MRWNAGQISLTGDREDNQDRVSVSGNEDAFLAVVADGMGGHAEGARAAELAIETCIRLFGEAHHPIENPKDFLEQLIERANRAVNDLGGALPVELMPRTTIAVALIQENKVYWAHVGDSRVYLLRGGEVVARTRDHSHVEILLQEGLITESEIAHHPLRNFVESCLGGGSALPELNFSGEHALETGDVVLLCTDGLWGGLDEVQLASYLFADRVPIARLLKELCEQAVAASFPNADNTTAAAVIWQGTGQAPAKN